MEWTPIINAVIALIGAVITYFLIPYIKSKTTEAQQKKIEYWISTIVKSAEQLHKGESGVGAIKKKEVLEFLENIGVLEEEDASKVDAMIEAEVFSLDK